MVSKINLTKFSQKVEFFIKRFSRCFSQFNARESVEKQSSGFCDSGQSYTIRLDL